jgi:N-acetylmuramoyl-L-alanine amidase
VSNPLTPNFDYRPEKARIDLLVLHYTGMKNGKEALDKMCDPVAKVSAHYMVDRDGSVVNLVSEDKRAWHAGISCWQGMSSLNDTSLGIEIVNPGHEWGYIPFTDEQMASVTVLCKEVMARHGIEARNVVGHSDIAPSRKEDPGELFDWKGLALEGIGLWPDVKKMRKSDETLIALGSEDIDVGRIQKMLLDYGYHIRVDGYYGSKTEDVVRGFKRHYVTEHLNVSWDRLADARLKRLLEMVGEA